MNSGTTWGVVTWNHRRFATAQCVRSATVPGIKHRLEVAIR